MIKQTQKQNTSSIQEVYKNGYKFTNPLPERVSAQMQRIFDKKASLIVIDGEVGSGKTTLAVEIADYVNKSPIVFQEQLAMGGGDFKTKLALCFDKQRVVIIYDEAGDFNSRGALTKFNQQINRVFELYRAFKILVILCLPDFAVLDKSLLKKGIPRMLINCYGRRKNYGKFRVYSLPRMFYLLHWRSKVVVPMDAYKYQSPNYYGLFKDLNPERAEALEKFSIEGKLDIVTGGKPKGSITKKYLAKEVQMSVEWVKQKLTKLKIKPIKKVGRCNYYAPEVLEILEGQRRL